MLNWLKKMLPTILDMKNANKVKKKKKKKKNQNSAKDRMTQFDNAHISVLEISIN